MRVLFVENHRVFAETVACEFLGDHDVVIVSTVAAAFAELGARSFDANAFCRNA
jgi:hypothetical protein